VKFLKKITGYFDWAWEPNYDDSPKRKKELKKLRQRKLRNQLKKIDKEESDG
jgi:hypothetical protein